MAREGWTFDSQDRAAAEPDECTTASALPFRAVDTFGSSQDSGESAVRRRLELRQDQSGLAEQEGLSDAGTS